VQNPPEFARISHDHAQVGHGPEHLTCRCMLER
jgi:hypothetical protein